MSRLASLANSQYLPDVVNGRTPVAAAIRGRVGVKRVLGVLERAPLRCANASHAQKQHLIGRRKN
jgi:hypothetical protein